MMDLKLITITILLLRLSVTRLAFGAVIKRVGSQTRRTNDITHFSNDEDLVGIEKCKTIPETILSAVLGPAFNARYMSIDDPRDDSVDSGNPKTPGMTKRKTNRIPSFTVEEEFNSIFSNDPAWDFEFSNVRYEDRVEDDQEKIIENDNARELRHVKSTPWQCEAKVDWIDLGRDYFPRFLRTVECVKSNCWYGFYTCKPRSFTVKLLRRRSGICIPSPSIDEMLKTSNIGITGLPNELKELWVWEERAVNFCCECAAGSSSS